MRNRDNYKNAFDYIKNQLFPYDYNNKSHQHILKLKIWALDGEILKEETNVLDTDVLNPVNHKASLENELAFLECYRKTEDKLLTKYEQKFSQMVSQRKQTMRQWVRTKDPITGQKRFDYEMSYSSRPTLLTNDQFRELYLLYKVKEKKGELSNCLEILSKITTDNIDAEKVQQESAILNYKQPAETKADMLAQAQKIREEKDDNLVNEMLRVHNEIVSILTTFAPDKLTPPEPPEPDEETGAVPPHETWSGISVVALNFPSPREYVSLSVDSSHKGFIQEEYLHSGGYRFKGFSADLVTPVSLPGKYEDRFPPLNYVITASPYKIGDVEWTYSDFLFAHMYTVTPASDSGNVEPTTYIKPSKVTWDYCASKNPRLTELLSRWYDFNQIRENRVKNNGTRAQIESLVSSNVESIEPDLISYFNILKSEKDNIEDILQERCLFNEWK